MPQQTVYIRNEDMEAWKAIEYKAQWIHDHLGVSSLRSEPKSINQTPILKPEVPEEMAPKFCPNGHPIPFGRDKCLGKGCKYS